MMTDTEYIDIIKMDDREVLTGESAEIWMNGNGIENMDDT